MLKERRVVGSRSERRDAERRVLLGVTAIGLRMAEYRAAARLVKDRLAGPRSHDVLRHLAKELLQAVRSAGVQPAFAGAVGVDVSNRLLLQLRLVFLRPLSGAKQSPFFAVPQREDDRARRTPSRFQQFAKTARRLHQR